MSKRNWIVVGAVVVVLAVGGGAWALFSKDSSSESPPPVTLAAPAPQASTDTGASSASADGTWKVGPSSSVGYRVREQLAFFDAPNDAIGKTTAVTGTMQVAGTAISAGKVEADLGKLTSDQSRRDNAIRNNGLESAQFPSAAFELAQPVTLPNAPRRGQELTLPAAGKLTLHGVTKDVQVTLKGRWDGATIQIAGQFPVKLVDYGMTPPKVGPVLSIGDSGTVELALSFVRG